MEKILIKGMKSLKEIIDMPDRSYNIEVLKHFPYEEFDFSVNKEAIWGHTAYMHNGATKEFWDAIYFEREMCLRAFPDKWFAPDAYAAIVENGILIGNSGMVVTPDGWLIKESASLAGHWHDGRCIDVPMLLEKIKEIKTSDINYIDGHAYAGVNPSRGYAHHLTENCLPLLLFLDVAFDYVLTTPGPNNKIVKQWLELTNFSQDKILEIPPTAVIQAKQLSFYGAASHHFTRAELLTIIREKVLPVYGSKEKPYKKLFLNSRSSVRKNHAEEEIEQFFLGHGYESVDIATLDFKEKMHLLSSAKTIVSLQGSATWNILCFAPTDVVRIILLNPAYLPNPIIIQAVVPHYNYVHVEPLYPFMYDFFGYRPMSSCIPTSVQKNYNDVLKGIAKPVFSEKRLFIPLKSPHKDTKRENIFDVTCDIDELERFYNLLNID